MQSRLSIKGMTLLLFFALLLAACSPAAPTAEPTKPAGPAPTTAGAAPTTAGAARTSRTRRRG